MIKQMAILLILASQVYGETLEEYNHIIGTIANPSIKQILICEREANIIKKNPQECLKAADMFLADKKKVTKKTDNKDIDEKIAEAYLNAGVIYSNIKEDNLKVKMYQKALHYRPNDEIVYYNLGRSYYFGKGVESNKIKAYEHFRIAAKLGHPDAQYSLDSLCSESPWACK